MKILCVCEGGYIRSVAMKHYFEHVEGVEALSVGIQASTRGTLQMLADWADQIAVAEEWVVDYLPADCREKVWSVGIGPDRWGVDDMGAAIVEIAEFMAAWEHPKPAPPVHPDRETPEVYKGL